MNRFAPVVLTVSASLTFLALAWLASDAVGCAAAIVGACAMASVTRKEMAVL